MKDIFEKTDGFGVIYLFTSPSGKNYVGQSINFRQRYNSYRILKKGTQKVFLAALKKYGIENFDLRILATMELDDDIEVTKSKLDELEIHFIDKYEALTKGYNCTAGGKGSYKRCVSEETRAKLSESVKAYKSANKIQCVTVTCTSCSTKFLVKPSVHRRKMKISSTGNMYCSKGCSYDGLRKK